MKFVKTINNIAKNMHQDAVHWAQYTSTDMYKKEHMRKAMQQIIGEKRSTVLNRDVASRAAMIARTMNELANK